MRSSLRLRSARGVNVYATRVPSGETAASVSSPSASSGPCSRASGRGPASPRETTARRVYSPSSTGTTSPSSVIHLGPPQATSATSTSGRGGPPAAGTRDSRPSSTYATVVPSGESCGLASSQYGIGWRPVVTRSGTRSSRSRSHTSEVSRSWTKRSRRPSAEMDRERGRSTSAIASSVQCGADSASATAGAGAPPYSSFPTQKLRSLTGGEPTREASL